MLILNLGLLQQINQVSFLSLQGHLAVKERTWFNIWNWLDYQEVDDSVIIIIIACSSN